MTRKWKVQAASDERPGMDAVAFVPGHITGFFSAHPHEDPARAGSRGGGVALSAGVEVRVTDGTPGTFLDGEVIEVEAVERVRAALDAVDVRLEVATDLPLGAGFGVSGAMALGTALAMNAALERACSENHLVGLAHRAEVEAGTGLGDVVAQARGGIPLRLEPGAPEHGELDGVSARPRVEYLPLGELSTEDVLAGDTTDLSAAGERALNRVRERPTAEEFMRASRSFAENAGLLTDDLRGVLTAVDDIDETASMAMLGETAFAFGTALSDAGFDPAVCTVYPAGATLR